MTDKAPPVPPANRSPEGPGAESEVSLDTTKRDHAPDTDKQGQSGNTAINTTAQGSRRN